MAEFKTVMGAFQRLCSERKCGSCPVGYRVFNERESYCCVWAKNHPEESERIIMQWAKENPLMTNRMKFKEVFGFEFTARVPESQYHREWLDAEYKGEQDGKN